MDERQNKKKIINDPVLGFINIPSDLLYDLIQHPYMQRLNRIKQLGLSSFVYPGTQHTRFLHSLGAMHLTSEAISQLKAKGNAISEEETEATLCAILLHDIGHGPFSHALEGSIISDFEHEKITLLFIENINREMGGKLDLTISIFNNTYHKKYLHQLISGQLDMDRLDYLIRDSFFSGVREGNIGAERIIKMLNVKDDNLVVEEKGIYSVENFLIARRLMYWQVYLHKTEVAAEKMMINILKRAKYLAQNGQELFASPSLSFFLKNNISGADFQKDKNAIKKFFLLDDSDILCALKVWINHSDKILATLSNYFINRKLFKVKIGSEPNTLETEKLKKLYTQQFGLKDENDALYFLSEGLIHSRTYDPTAENILIMEKNGETKEISEVSDILNTKMLSFRTTKYYLCYMPV